MLRTRRLATICLLALAMTCTSCAWSIGSKGKQVSRQPTIAEELRDLEKAREEGLLSDEEYTTTRQRLLEAK